MQAALGRTSLVRHLQVERLDVRAIDIARVTGQHKACSEVGARCDYVRRGVSGTGIESVRASRVGVGKRTTGGRQRGEECHAERH